MMKQRTLFDEPEKHKLALNKISEIPYEERPAYKIDKYPTVMSSRELLARLSV